jgi:hypothetical protein
MMNEYKQALVTETDSLTAKQEVLTRMETTSRQHGKCPVWATFESDGVTGRWVWFAVQPTGGNIKPPPIMERKVGRAAHRFWSLYGWVGEHFKCTESHIQESPIRQESRASVAQ